VEPRWGHHANHDIRIAALLGGFLVAIAVRLSLWWNLIGPPASRAEVSRS
jgi:hypothetical protein